MNTRNLPCKLTKKEMEERASTLAELYAEQHTLKDAAKEHAREVKTRLDAIDKAMFEAHAAVRSGVEYRDVATIEEKNFEANCIDVIRRDTGEIVESRPMRPEDQQVSFLDVSTEARR